MSILTLFLILTVVITVILLVLAQPLSLTLRKGLAIAIGIITLLWFLERFGVFGPMAGVTVN